MPVLDKERIYPEREPKCLDTANEQTVKHRRTGDMLQTFGSTTNTVSLVALMLYKAIPIVSRAIEITRIVLWEFLLATVRIDFQLSQEI